MKINVISMPVCKQCTMVKKMLEKYGMKYDIEEHDNPELDEYPVVVIDGKKYNYHDFLVFYKDGGLSEIVQ